MQSRHQQDHFMFRLGIAITNPPPEKKKRRTAWNHPNKWRLEDDCPFQMGWLSLRIQTPPDRVGLMVETSHPHSRIAGKILFPGHTWILRVWTSMSHWPTGGIIIIFLGILRLLEVHWTRGVRKCQGGKKGFVVLKYDLLQKHTETINGENSCRMWQKSTVYGIWFYLDSYKVLQSHSLLRFAFIFDVFFQQVP